MGETQAITVVLPTPADTHALGLRIGRVASAGTVLALIGDLGAGKTALVRGLAEGLGVPTRVQSPTFVLVHAHDGGRVPLWHADLYRLDAPAQADALGLAELGANGVLAVEWADRFPDAGILPDDRLEIVLSPLAGSDNGDEGRVATVRATGPAHAALASAVVEAGDG